MFGWWDKTDKWLVVEQNLTFYLQRNRYLEHLEQNLSVKYVNIRNIVRG